MFLTTSIRKHAIAGVVPNDFADRYALADRVERWQQARDQAHQARRAERSPDGQLTGALRSLDITLDDDVLKQLDQIFPGPGGAAPEAYAW